MIISCKISFRMAHCSRYPPYYFFCWFISRFLTFIQRNVIYNIRIRSTFTFPVSIFSRTVLSDDHTIRFYFAATSCFLSFMSFLMLQQLSRPSYISIIPSKVYLSSLLPIVFLNLSNQENRLRRFLTCFCLLQIKMYAIIANFDKLFGTKDS